MTVQQDRRDARVQRIPFEALVEIGGDGTPAFEAESVDISTGGMHLRSAYLPELGQPIVCRFDTGEGEPICAEGHVVWRDEGAIGGELGIQFTNVDEPSAAALLEMCGVPPAELEPARSSQPPSSPPAKAEPGSRVRLHIEGLASPMKARVRTVGDKQLLVGTKLDFLRIGRPLDLEAVDQQERRPAEVERVSVDIDPASKVPQLVIELRYTDVAQDEPKPAPVVIAQPIAQAAPAPASKPSPEPLDDDEAVAEPESTREPVFRARTAVEAAEDPMLDDELVMAGSVKESLGRAASRIGPTLASVGSRAKTTMELLFAKSRGRNEIDEDLVDVPPRRTTAPPPSGALQAMGRRVIRDDGSSFSEATPIASKKRSRAIALGASAGVLTVLLAMAFNKPATPPPGASAGDDLATTAPAPAEAAYPSVEALAEIAPDTVVANVPLFGPTPLTTAVIPSKPAAPADELLGEAAGTGDSALLAAEASAAAETDSMDDDFPVERPRRAAAPKPVEAKKVAEKKVAAFTSGKVTRPKALRLRMDDAITSIRGTRSADGFTVLVAARRSKDKAGPLASKDERILQSKILNGAKGAELTIRFKDEVPAYAVRADGHDLVIELETAKKGKPSATAKKGRVGKKN